LARRCTGRFKSEGEIQLVMAVPPPALFERLEEIVLEPDQFAGVPAVDRDILLAEMPLAQLHHAQTVAMLIIAMMVTDNLSKIDDRVRKVAKGKYLERSELAEFRCTLTGARDFKSAFAALLRMSDYPEGLTIFVERNILLAEIRWTEGSSYFVGGKARQGSLDVVSSLDEKTLKSISAAFRRTDDEQLHA
jgi:hypothetical protein